ncbi:hypothetical protein BD324DRAFT_678783 [Kockovaella imperatae]|uniref:Uncharacterized protein n=1 Tax=Kockovaella imperatae TaxID=4999 RepID=A0A1Y1UNQ3_9TREE|nr:hypothetical protein BD324DRAFT_678783 [Kockovaella imperatae]ORX39673.1 hypothetical protein BD324DRAFT_678783 [Kockovaella imperatae]
MADPPLRAPPSGNPGHSQEAILSVVPPIPRNASSSGAPVPDENTPAIPSQTDVEMIDSPIALGALAAAVLASTELDVDEGDTSLDFGFQSTSWPNGHDSHASPTTRGAQNLHETSNSHPGSSGRFEIPSSSATAQGRPPYTPPSSVEYPDGAMLNPHRGSMDVQPTFGNLPSGSLYRPAYLPHDIDPRIDQRSVWMGIEKKTSKAVYFLPPTCRGCNHPAVAQFCDRGFPKCYRCTTKDLTCVPGSLWGVMKPKGKRRAKADNASEVNKQIEDGNRRLTAEEKGKSRASASFDDDMMNGTSDEEEHGKRVKKRRKLSLAGDTHLNGVENEGSVTKPMRRTSKPGFPLAMRDDSPPQIEDRDMMHRIQVNAAKGRLSDMSGACPVWANSKRTLEVAVEYLRQPVRTDGASVQVGVGGIARGVILEGEPPDDRTFWQMDQSPGTIITSIGPERPLKPAEKHNHVSTVMPETYVAPLSPTLPNISVPASSSADAHDPPEIAALLAAQRARTPVALCVTTDYRVAPFRVPRRMTVLGWFWVTEAWLEPVGAFAIPPLAFRWRFRFDWCSGQSKPWWLPQSAPFQFPAVDDIPGDISASISGIQYSTTVREDGKQGRHSGKSDSPFASHCSFCDKTSTRVYSLEEPLCLNPECAAYCVSFIAKHLLLDPSKLTPAALEPLPRITPLSLGLSLRPQEPSASSQTTGRQNAGRDFWRAWVCGACGFAQERKRWFGWECEACHRTIQPARKIYSVEDLQSPSRATYTGPRQEDGNPSWPFESTRAWTLYRDGVKVVKVVKHSVEAGLGQGAEVQHALASKDDVADSLLKQLQTQGQSEIPLRRHSYPDQRVVDKVVSPFYTFLCGSEAPVIDSIPAGKHTKWKKCPELCLSAADLLNDMAGRMFPGDRERFNSLLIVAVPPQLPVSLQPRITIAPQSLFAILYLGSDGLLKIASRVDGKRGKNGSLTALHGDVIGIRTGSDPIEVIPSMDGFGFLLIGRQVYRKDDNDEPPPPVLVKGWHPIPGWKSRVTSSPRLTKPTKIPQVAPLTDWYIGSRPLSKDQPLRVRAPLRKREVNRETTGDQDMESASTADVNVDAVTGVQSSSEYTGREIVKTPPPPELTRPPPISPMGKKKKLDKEGKVEKEVVKVDKKPKGRGGGKRKSDAASSK